MLATDSIRNAQGGIIAGREVSLTALTGDVINERSVTRLEGRAGGEHVTKDLVDSAARIEAANDLTVTAGRDIGNVGGVVKAGGNLDMEASRNLSLTSQQSLESHEYQRRRVSGYDTTITQYGGEVTAGGSITATAGQDLSVIASEIEARRNLTLSAGNDILLSSAANEEHDYAKGKKGQTKTTTQLDDVRQVGASLKAGGDIQVEAGNDLKMVASKVSAGEDAYLVAGGKLELLAEYDSHYSLYDMSKKGNWGSSKTQRDEVTDVKAVGSEVSSGGSTSLVSGGDQLYQGAKVEAGSDLAIISGGAVTFEAVKDMHQESHEKSKGDLAWNSAKGRGTTDETLRQNQLVAQGVLTIKAVDGLKIDIKHIDQATVSQSIDAMIVADPKLAWLKEAELRGDVDWRRVKEVHDSFKYDQSGLGAGASLVIAIIVTYLTWGAGASAVGAASNSTLGFAANSVVSAAATNAATSAVNNRGNLGAVVKDVTSSDAMKGYVMSALAPGGDSIVSRIALKAALSTVVYGGSLKDNAVQAGLEIAADALSGAIFNEVGDRLMGSGLPKRVAVHAIVGGLIAEAAGGDFRTAALAAGANEALVQLVGDKIFPGEAHDRVLGMTSQLVGMTVAAGLGADAKDQQVAAWVAQQATQNNFLRHKEVEAFLAELKTCDANNSCADVRKRYGDLNIENQERLERLCARDMDACRSEYKLFSDDYQKTHALLAGSMKEVGWKEQYALGATILSNYQAMQTLVGTAMTKAMTDAAQEAAGQAGVGVDAEDVGTFGMWLRTVVKAVTSRKGAVGGTERGPCCFAAGTLVATPGGDRAIETLKVGDIVWTKPEHGGEPFAAAITATHIRNDQPIYRLTLESTRADGQVQTETLFVTPSHPFYVPARHDFVPMGDLRTGDLLQSLADGAGNDTSSRVALIRLHKSVGETFNLSVDVGHTFYVGKLKTWVHNVGPCGESDAAKPGMVDAKGGATWHGSGPAPGVLGLEPGSVSVKAVQNYFPSTKNGSIEFVFDPKTSTFVVGKPTTNLGGSPHQQLAKTIDADSSTLVGGMFRRGTNGEVITNEYSGHYWKNWSPEVRHKFEQAMKQYGLEIKHHPGM